MAIETDEIEIFAFLSYETLHLFIFRFAANGLSHILPLLPTHKLKIQRNSIDLTIYIL